MPKVGEIFREEREKQGLTLRDIEEMTSIRLKYLEAIENGNNEALPGDVYAKGFVRNYASTLGLDANEFVSLYKLELEHIQDPAPVYDEPTHTKQPENIQKAIVTPTAESFTHQPAQAQVKSAAPERKTNLQPKLKIAPILMFLSVFIVSVLVGVYVILTFFYDSPQNESHEQTNQQAHATQTAETTTAGVEVEETAQQSPAQTAIKLNNDMQGNISLLAVNNAKIEQIDVEAAFTADCWTSVTADGRQIFSGMMRRGSRQTWQARQNMQLRIGNVAVADIKINGQTVERIADGGPVVDVNISIPE